MENSSIQDTKDLKESAAYSSHKEALMLALNNTKGDIIELGCGLHSTPFIYYNCEDRNFISFETDEDWAALISSKYPDIIIHSIDSYDEVYNFEITDIGFVFIDHAPGERRKVDIEILSTIAPVLVVHDTEDVSNYVYGMMDILNTFKYRVDFKPEGLPQTTIVSNFIDVSKW
jgi:hypothetical protein